MKNWKTLLGGLIAGLPLAYDSLMTAFNAGAFTGKSGGQLALAIGLILLGVYAKDRNVTGGKVEQ